MRGAVPIKPITFADASIFTVLKYDVFRSSNKQSKSILFKLDLNLEFAAEKTNVKIREMERSETRNVES